METKEKTTPAGGTRRKKTAAARADSGKKPVSGTRTPQKRPAPAKKSGTPRRVAVRKTAQKKPGADVVYTPPGPFNVNRFLLRLVTVVAVVFALIFGMAIFFRVKEVTVAGMNKYSYWDVREAAGIQDGENLLTLSEAKVSSSILAKLPYVKSVRVGIKLPDTVKIEVEELDVVYAVNAADGAWWLMRYDGMVVDKTNPADAEQYTKILGVALDAPEVGQMAVAAEPVQESTDEAGETLPTVPVTVRASEQLDGALRVIRELEDRGIFGEVVSVDVTGLSQIELWYGDRFQILLGDTSYLREKLNWAITAIETKLSSYDSGILDVSQTVQPDPESDYKVIYTPFED